MTKEERIQELLSDTTLYCCYCGTQKHSFQCCGEVHYQTFYGMSAEEQNDFLSFEEFDDEAN
jgi:hypothetical protein